jgi:glycosyltransferase involved in cell wall biosynthesis
MTSFAGGGILHLVDSLGLGGVQTLLKSYFETRPADPARHLYALRSVPGQIRIDHPNVAVHASHARFSFAPLFALRRLLRSRTIAVLHCHLFRAQVFGFLLKVLFFPRIALVFHEHGRVVGREGESRLEERAFRMFMRLSRRRVDRYVCISAHTRERLLELIPDCGERATVVTNPVTLAPQDPPADRAALRRAYGAPDGAFVVGFASRLIERKGWMDFLEATARIDRSVPVFFLLAGNGEDRAKVEARALRADVAGRGRVLGHVERMAEFHACLDCFVMPSHWEPFGLSHLEAQAFGVPVVVSNVPGLASTVHEGVDALLVSPRDVEALAAAIARLAAEPSLRERLSAAGRMNASRHSPEKFAADLDAVYAEVAHAAGSVVGEPKMSGYDR